MDHKFNDKFVCVSFMYNGPFNLGDEWIHDIRAICEDVGWFVTLCGGGELQGVVYNHYLCS